MTATPWGFRDILPEEAQAREEIALTVKGCFREQDISFQPSRRFPAEKDRDH